MLLLYVHDMVHIDDNYKCCVLGTNLKCIICNCISLFHIDFIKSDGILACKLPQCSDLNLICCYCMYMTLMITTSVVFLVLI